MITKGLIKKTLTAGMLALMACTSMSAMAKEQWVFAGDYFNEPNIRIYEDENICKFWAEHFDRSWGSSAGQDKITFTGEVEDYFYAGEPRKWCHMENHPNGGFSFGPQCDRGTYSHSRPDGCYEFKEPNPVPPIKENSSWCNLANPNGVIPLGNVACVGDEIRSACVWKDPSWVTDEEAIARVRYCIREHEEYHIQIEDSMGSYCNDKSRSENPTFTLYTPKPNRYLGEMLSYEESMVCLERQRDQCNTKACYDQVEQSRKNDVDSAVDYGDLYRDWDTEQEKSD